MKLDNFQSDTAGQRRPSQSARGRLVVSQRAHVQSRDPQSVRRLPSDNVGESPVVLAQPSDQPVKNNSAAGLAGATMRASKAALSKLNGDTLASVAASAKASARKLTPTKFRSRDQMAAQSSSAFAVPPTAQPPTTASSGMGSEPRVTLGGNSRQSAHASRPVQPLTQQPLAASAKPLTGAQRLTTGQATGHPQRVQGGFAGSGVRQSVGMQPQAAATRVGVSPQAVPPNHQPAGLRPQPVDRRAQRPAGHPVAAGRWPLGVAEATPLQRRLTRTVRVLYRLKPAHSVTPQASGWRQRIAQFKRGGWSWPTDRRRWVLFLLAGALVLLVVYVAIDALFLKPQSESQARKRMVAAAERGDPAARQAAEGKDEQPITAEAIDEYAVAADLPRVLSINKLDVRARVLPMGVNDDGSMQAPINIADAGWYNGSVRPGQAGATVVVAHVAGPTKQGIFARLGELAAGDEISVQRGDQQTIRYQVVRTETAKLAEIDMHKFMRPIEGVTEGLNLMTCASQTAGQENDGDQRIMVYAKRL